MKLSNLRGPAAIPSASAPRNPRGGMVTMTKLLSILAPLLLAASGTAGHSQPCNPAIDGTYCASVPIRKPASAASPAASSLSGTLGGAISSGSYDQPATLGAITFSGDSRCIGLLRRMNCK